MEQEQILNHSFKHYINGELVTGNSTSCQVVCPGTEETVTSFRLADDAQANAALEAARDAFPSWSALTVEQRAQWVKKLVNAIKTEEDQIARLLSLETGKLLHLAYAEIQSIYNYLTFFVEQAKMNNDVVIRDRTGGKGHYLVVREPLGVVVGILAWNLPIHNLATKLGPVIASGCTAVIKPATKTPLSTLYIGEILHKINFPKGVLNFVAGNAHEIGQTLISSKIPAMLSMIGSSAGGRQLIKESSTSIKRFSLELGGNTPVIVTANADIVAAAKHCVVNKMSLAGQTCVSPQRVFVERSVYQQFVAACIDEASTARCGTLDEKDCNTGPLIDGQAVERMEMLVNDAITKGANLGWGGKRPDYKQKGYFFLPTILSDITPEMRVFREEVFGPILGIMPYDQLDEAISLANDTEYGLSSYVWSNDLNEVNHISRGLHVGIVNVNGPGTGPHLPHGGVKESGVGKDGSHYSLDEYYYLKCIRVGLENIKQ